ncbi:MAG: hypothetical protein CMF41_02840 [Legionellales bacterium]|nr:hypothetical protein [Legionellales bacterium]OUX65444.1 MAG: hypothetical protein CBE41_01640 [Gammaproteobacteria bacterium TMED281]|tara:strand:- start:1151 stop:1345 length:195 start_codon:yes stop_codon:yes gene_type:complete
MKEQTRKDLKTDPRVTISLNELTSIFSILQKEIEESKICVDDEIFKINYGEVIKPSFTTNKTNN